tara:strand:- start:1701 stop:2222 length:522 start_codon:yes stop_codon:yes gene_type:complete
MNKIINSTLVIFFLFVSNISNAITEPPFNNIIVNENTVKYNNILFKDYDGNSVSLKNQESQFYFLNFWATWCLPCKEEMSYLDKLQNVHGIKVFPINIEKMNKHKTEKFFKNLKIKNLSIYFDIENNLVNLFKLRGIPTTIILNKDKNEIARVVGAVDFSDQKFLDWISNISD